MENEDKEEAILAWLYAYFVAYAWEQGCETGHGEARFTSWTAPHNLGADALDSFRDELISDLTVNRPGGSDVEDEETLVFLTNVMHLPGDDELVSP